MGGLGGLGGLGGAAGVMGNFDPRSLSDLALWLDAPYLGLADAAAVATFTDRSGLSNDFTEATNKPAYKVNIQNGLAVVRFDGVNDVMSRADDADLDFQDTGISIFVVYQSAGDPVGLLSHYDVAGAYNGWGLTQGLGPTVGTRLSLWTDDKAAWVEDNAALGDTNFHVGTVVVTAAGAVTFYRDGTAAGTSTGCTLDASTNTIYLGADGAGASLAALDIGELAAYGRELAANEIATVHNYLKKRWGI